MPNPNLISQLRLGCAEDLRVAFFGSAQRLAWLTTAHELCAEGCEPVPLSVASQFAAEPLPRRGIDGGGMLPAHGSAWLKAYVTYEG